MGTLAARPRPIVRATDLGSVHVLKHRGLFLLSDPFGDIHLDARGLGLYDGDTRILSCAVLRVGGERPVVLRSDPGDAWRGVILATNPELRRHPGDKAADLAGDAVLARRTLSIVRERIVADRFREVVSVANHTPTAQDITIELGLNVDGADIFEVRGYDRPARGQLEPIEVAETGLVFTYRGLDGVELRTCVDFDPPPTVTEAPKDQDAAVVATWRWRLEPGRRPASNGAPGPSGRRRVGRSTPSGPIRALPTPPSLTEPGETACRDRVRQRAHRPRDPAGDRRPLPPARHHRRRRPVRGGRGAPSRPSSGATRSSRRSERWPSPRASPRTRCGSSPAGRRPRRATSTTPTRARSSTSSASGELARTGELPYAAYYGSIDVDAAVARPPRRVPRLDRR